MSKIIGVVGNSVPLKEYEKIAEDLGALIAEKGWILVCGGLGGVMESVAKGARSKDGLTIGILPGSDKKDANPHIQVPILTSMQQARNAIIVRTADIVIAVGGGLGTLSEIAMALKINKPVISISSWDVDDKVIKVNEAQGAITEAEKIFSSRKK
ncbi:TIGR00725 family protein [bacterium]|nr:TIGR00725 family protein [bacterium]MCK5600072.1 TIGR00725 family protein [bacterium]